MSSFDEFPRVRPVRPYVITEGRARPTRNTMRPETLLVADAGPEQLPVTASSEKRSLLRMCQRLLSLVEAAAHLQLPVSVVGVVASDLVDEGFLTMHVNRAARPSRDLLQEILNGLERL
jgi:hypothetical protein